MSYYRLYQSSPPWIYLDVLSEEESKWLPTHLYGKDGISSAVRILRGEKMRTRQALMDEFGASLQFFEDFGENWYALKECLSYLDEWLAAEVYVLVFTQPIQILADSGPQEMKWLFQTLEEVGEWWSKPVVDNDRFNRASVPFHSVFQCQALNAKEVLERFSGLPLLRK